MSYNGSGTFQINTSGQPVVTGTSISSTVFNALTADLATGLSTAITKDGQTTTTARIPFALGINSTLVTDATNTTSGSIITAGGVGIAKALFVGTTANVAGAVTLGGVATFSAQPIFSSLTASSAVATDASKGLVSVTNTGTGNNVLATGPTISGPTISDGTANGVAYLNGSKVLTTGSALVFDGSNLGVGVTPSAWNSTEKAVQIINTSFGGGVFASGSNIGTLVGSNAYWSSAGYKRINAFASSVIQFADGQARFLTAATGAADSAITFTQAMTLDASGNLGVGTSSPAAKLDAFQSSTGTYFLGGGGDNKARQLAITSSTTTNSGDTHTFNAQSGTGNIAFAIAGSEKARIDTSGNLLIGKTALNSAVGTSIDANTSTGIGVRVVSSSSTTSADGFQMYSTGAAAYRFYVSFNGTISATNTTISSLSDQRHKENIRNLNVGLAEVMALKPRLFDWKEGKGADIKNARGFIAQEFEEVFPDLIDEWKDPAPEGEEPYKSVRQDLIPVLVKAIQELNAKFEEYKATHP